jgi:hypothetical protein
MYTQKNITNSRFTVRFCTVAKYLGFKKVGPFEKLLRQMQPNNKITFGPSHARVSRLLKEIDDFKVNPNDYDFFASRPGDLDY